MKIKGIKGKEKMKAINVFVTILLVSVVLNLLMSVSGATWCDNGCAKKINVSVNNTAGSALTNYQVYVNLSTNPINETSIRVYNSTSCTLRPHWCENITSGNCTKLWINYSAIVTSSWINNTAIYYDNAAASSASNGTNTFEFFDDFLGASIDASKWDTSGTVTVASSIVTVDGTGSNIKSKTTINYGTNYAIRTLFKSSDGLNINAGWEDCVSSSDFAIFYSAGSSDTVGSNRKAGVSGPTIDVTDFSTDYHIGDIIRNGTTSVIYKVDDTDGGSETTQVPIINLRIRVYTSAGSQLLHWILVRKYTSPEPSSTLGSTEYGNVYNVSGYVKTSLGVAIENAYVSNNVTSATNYTNASGYYILSVLNATYNISASKVQYATNYTVATISGADLTNRNITLNEHESYIPPDPINLQNTTGNYWVNHTWSPGSSGNITDLYSVKVNDVWHNATANTYWNDTYGPLLWQNISIYAYNNTNSGTTSISGVSDNAQCPGFAWSYGKNITLLGMDTQLTNFPYLVSITKELHMDSDYSDLVFFDGPVDQGGSNIEYEIETYNSTVATIWLNITTLPIAGKTIAVYYGGTGGTPDAEAVWDSDYIGVWHLADDSTGYAWNDYKDPDGVITANSSVIYIYAEPSIYYRNGYFHLWMRGNMEVDYFRSSNGYDWTCMQTNVTKATDAYHPFVMEDPDNPGEYFLYGRAAFNQWMNLHHSTNETNFSLVQSNIFTAADVGGTSLGNVFVWREGTSDWYMLCEYYSGGWVTKYATSSDGINWTFHNQCIISGFGSNSFSGPWVTKNNGTYYCWFHGNPNVASGIPSDTYVATSTNRQDWTYQPAYNITREYDWEGVGNSGGQLADPHLVEYEGETYLYYQGAYDQSPCEAKPHTIGLVHFNETVQELCDRIDAGVSEAIIINDSTNQNDGWLDGSAESSIGIIGRDMKFTSTDHIQIPSSDFYNIGTISYWMNSTSSVSGNHRVFTGNENVTDSANYIIYGTTTAKKHDIYNEVSGPLTAEENTVTDNKYQHVTWTSNGTTTKCFVNGTEISLTGTNTGTWFSDVSSINKYGISSFKRAAQQYDGYTGEIDQVELSKSVRSDDWINLSYQMVVNSSYVTFGGEENNVTSTTPIISNVQNGSISSTSQYINWTVNQTAHNRVLYSNESDLTPAWYSTWDNSTAAPNMTLSALTASTQYWYQVWSYNTSNNTLSDNSSTLSFTTASVDTSFTVTLPSGHSHLKFEPSNSTAQNVTPNGQTDSQEFYNVTNTGNLNLDIRLQLNETVLNIELKADSDNNPLGAKEVNTTLVTIYSNLATSNSADIWLWSDFSHTLEQDTNKTINVNVTQST